MSENETWKQNVYRQVMDGQLERDIVVVEDVRQVPILDTEYHTQFFYIGLCLKGRTMGQYDYRDTDFRAGDVCWLPPNHVLSHRYVSDDYTVLSLFITRDYYYHLKQQGVLGRYQLMTQVPKLSLDPQEFETMKTAVRMLGLLATCESNKREDMVNAQCKIISMLSNEYMLHHMPDISKAQLLYDELFERFYEAIIQHYRENHEVAYYAGLLSLTPKYFATVIKKISGLPASEWINRYVIVEAKWLLSNQRKKSVQQIAHYLGFSEQASFSRFFKSNTRFTPTEFRNQF
ncbi:MAG: AraC family transcriptional regulator [Prevotella sp.]|nr:AraC family transcriptional regulator [Prevotella sp.]